MLVKNIDRYRSAWKPSVSKKYAKEYLTPELIARYKRYIEIKGVIIVTALIYDLLVLTRKLAKFRKEKMIIQADTLPEPPSDWLN